MNNIYLTLYNYCIDGNLDDIIFLYYTHSINIRQENDKIFKDCCNLLLINTNIDDEKYKNKLDVLLFLCTLCSFYYLQIQNKKLISWKIDEKFTIII
jgi:hypothetical protein